MINESSDSNNLCVRVRVREGVRGACEGVYVSKRFILENFPKVFIYF